MIDCASSTIDSGQKDRVAESLSYPVYLVFILCILCHSLFAQDVELNITNIDYEQNTFIVSITNSVEIFAFQLMVEGVDITEVEFYQDPWVWMIAGSDIEDGIIIAYTFDTPPIPPGEWDLIEVTFDAAEDSEVCITEFGYQWLYCCDGFESQEVACCSYFDIPPYLTQGDYNQDSAVDVLDIIGILNLILAQTEPVTFELYVADMDEDGAVDIIDIVLMVELILAEG